MTENTNFATEQTSYWVLKDNYPQGRRSSLQEADDLARKLFEQYPNSEVTIDKQVLVKQELRSYRPFKEKEGRRFES